MILIFLVILSFFSGRSLMVKKNDGIKEVQSTDSTTTIDDEDTKGLYRSSSVLLYEVICTFRVKNFHLSVCNCDFLLY